MIGQSYIYFEEYFLEKIFLVLLSYNIKIYNNKSKSLKLFFLNLDLHGKINKMLGTVGLVTEYKITKG